MVCDRFIASSLAYQGHGRQLPVDEVAYVNDWGTGGLRPDLTILLDVPEEVAAERMGTDLDRLEAVGDGFHQRVAEGYRTLAADDPDGWVVVDGSGTVDEVVRPGARRLRGAPRQPAMTVRAPPPRSDHAGAQTGSG